MGDITESSQRRSRESRSLLRKVTTLLDEYDHFRNSIALLESALGEAFDKIEAQNAREALLLRDRDQERKEFLLDISGLKERVRLLEEEKRLTLNRTNCRRKVRALFLHIRKGLCSTIEAQKRKERILLQERNELIDCFSTRVRAQMKRESQLLRERKIGEDRDTVSSKELRVEGLIEKILGRKESPSGAQAAVRDDVLDESQTMERQPQTKHNSLAALELEDSEKKQARRKQNKPRRLETRASPSPQETEVCRKRKRIGTHPPPSSEEMYVPRSRRKPQRYGTSPPPPSKRMRRPRERKLPQRYQ